MKHGLRDKVNKIASIIFMSVIAALLLFAFVPEIIQNLFNYESNVSNIIAARINGDAVARSEVSFYVERAYSKVPDQYKSYAESQALRSLIQRKLLIQIADDSGFLPTDDAKTAEFANFLQKNYTSYLNGDDFDIDQLSKDLARSNRYGLKTLADLQKLFTEDLLARKIKTSLGDSATFSDLEALEEFRLQQTKLSYRVVILDSASQKKILEKKEKRIRVTKKEIDTRFATKYLTKNKDDKLDKDKKEIITDEITSEKKLKLKADLTKEIKDFSKTASLASIARKYKLKIYNLEKVPLSQSLDKAKPKEVAASLTTLESSDTFRDKIFSNKLNAIIGPIEASGNTYFIAITARDIPNLPSAKEFQAMNMSFKNWAKEQRFNSAEIDKVIDSVKKSNSQAVEQAMLLKLEEDADVIHYARPS